MSIRGLIDTWGHKVDIQTVTETVDAGGSPVETFATNQRDVRCMLVVDGSPEFAIGGRPANLMKATGHFSATISLGESDRIIWVDGSTTRTFEVTALKQPMGLKSSNHLSRKIATLEQVE